MCVPFLWIERQRDYSRLSEVPGTFLAQVRARHRLPFWYTTRHIPYSIDYVPLVQHKTLALRHWLCPFGTAQDIGLMALAMSLWYSTRHWSYGTGYVPLVQHKTLVLWHWLCPFGAAQDIGLTALTMSLWYSTRHWAYGIGYVPLVQHKTMPYGACVKLSSKHTIMTDGQCKNNDHCIVSERRRYPIERLVAN